MNEVLIKTMAIAAFTVTIMGGILLSVLMGYWIFRLLASIWSRMSAFTDLLARAETADDEFYAAVRESAESALKGEQNGKDNQH